MQHTAKGRQLGIGDALSAPVEAGQTVIAGTTIGCPIAGIVATARMSRLEPLNPSDDGNRDVPLRTASEAVGQPYAFVHVAVRTKATIGSIHKQPTMPKSMAIGRNERQCWNS